MEDHPKPPYTLIKDINTIHINKEEYNCVEVVFVHIIFKMHVVKILKDTLGDPHLSHKQGSLEHLKRIQATP